MKNMILSTVVAFTFISSANADPMKGILSGELDPALEFEMSNPPTYNDCFRLGWTRGVHYEREGELEAWMPQCLSGQVPFTLNDRHFQRHRQEFLNRRN